MRTETGLKTGLSIVFVCFMMVLALPGPAPASDIGSPDLKVIEGLYPGKTYSPYAQRSFPSRVYWGETHLHTGVSLDAGLGKIFKIGNQPLNGQISAYKNVESPKNGPDWQFRFQLQFLFPK